MSELWEELNEGGALLDEQISAMEDADAERGSPRYVPDPAAVECAARALLDAGLKYANHTTRTLEPVARRVIVALVTEGHLTVPTEDHQTSLTMNDYKRAAEAQYDETMKAQAALAEAVALLRRCDRFAHDLETDQMLEAFLVAYPKADQ